MPGSFAQAIVNAAVARPAGAVGAPINAEEGIGLARVKAAQRPAQRGQHCTCAARSQKMAVEGRRSSLACWHLHALDLRRPVCQPEVASSSLVDPAITPYQTATYSRPDRVVTARSLSGGALGVRRRTDMVGARGRPYAIARALAELSRWESAGILSRADLITLDTVLGRRAGVEGSQLRFLSA